MLSPPLPKDSVHVQMETFEDYSPGAVQYDAAGNVIEKDMYDEEAQAIRGEFKRPPY
jgi:hypothetical protein